ncbi:MAG: PaaI family thioesterase [Deltaproteobacteria bacterium]|nr:PaaI family thioesterase [Deltaproteobacteria bacterium]
MSTNEEKAAHLSRIKEIVNKSPYYRHINMELVEFTDGGCVMKMNVEGFHCNIYDTAHGGAVASLADSACGLALATSINSNEFVMTQNLNINYLLPVAKGMLTAKGNVIRRGRNSAVLEADIFDESGRKIAHAHSIHIIRQSDDIFKTKTS